MTAGDVLRLVAGLLVVVVTARVLGLVAKRLRQPAVVGEILAGLLLGPTVLGAVAAPPDAKAVARFSASLFLLAAGMEVDLWLVRRQRRTAFAVGAGGLVFPFALGFAVASLAPEALGLAGGVDATSGAVFFGIALAISALPVIARTLMDLGLYRTDFGMTVIAAAVLDDLVGWVLFALLVSRFHHGVHEGLPASWTIPAVLVLTVAMLTLARRGVHHGLPFLSRTVGAPGVLAAAVAGALLVGAIAHGAGVHAMFGAFLTGIAFGDSERLPERSRRWLRVAVEWVFAPLFFGSIGLTVDFATHFDAALCGLVLVLACAAKLVGCSLGARFAGMSARRSWALGFAMNSRGAMEIMLGTLALEEGLIGRPLFVALVVMALATSLSSGPAIARLYGTDGA